MNKFLLTLIGLVVLIVLVLNDTWRLTLDTTNYSFSVSFILGIFLLCCLIWILGLLKKPFQWWQQFQNYKATKHQAKMTAYLSEVLTAYLSHHTPDNASLIKKAQKLYGSDSQEALLVTALLKPEIDIFQSLNATGVDYTKLAGLYGLIQEAESVGDFDKIADLLKQIPPTFNKTPWVQQTKMRLALNQSDWTEALHLLEQGKSYLSKRQYLSKKACLLLKLGKIKEAYKTCPQHPAIALAYAKFNQKKALKILTKAWNITPGWPLYQAIKNLIQHLPEKKQEKILLGLTRPMRDDRIALLVRADMDMTHQNWARAKENLEIYIQKYPLTRQVADMMATIERTAWHHEQIASDWEHKAVEAPDDTLWLCQACNHPVNEWQILCPHCNAFDTLYLK